MAPPQHAMPEDGGSALAPPPKEAPPKEAPPAAEAGAEEAFPLDGPAGWVVVAGSFAIHFVALGLVYSFGVFFLPIADEFGADRAEVSWASSLSVGMMLLGAGGAGQLVPVFGVRALVVAGAAGVSGGVLLTSWATAMWHVYLAYGLLTGLALSLCFTPAVSSVQSWFLDKRGLATGVAVAGSGLGNFAFPIVLQLAIDTHGWRDAMRYEAAVILAVLLASAALLRVRPGEAGRRDAEVALAAGAVAGAEPLGAADADADAAEEAAAPRQAPALRRMDTFRPTVRAASQTKEFRLLALANFVGSFGYGNPFVHIVPFADDEGISSGRSAMVLAGFGLASLFGRVILGHAADRGSRMNVLRASVLVMGVTSCLWPLVATTFWPLIGYSVLYGFNAGAFISLPPAIAADYFGAHNISGVVGLLFFANALPSAAGPVLSGLIFDQTGSYVGAGFLTGGALLGAVAIWSLVPPLRPAGDAPAGYRRASSAASVELGAAGDA